MLRRFAILLVLPAILTAAISGCGGGANPAKETSNDPAAKDAAKTADELPGLKELDEGDRKLAEEQKTCPVSSEALGGMGKPYKITLKGRTFFLCCKNCEEEARKDPDKCLKKLDQLLAKK